jgi:hypothetical protein
MTVLIRNAAANFTPLVLYCSRAKDWGNVKTGIKIKILFETVLFRAHKIDVF